MPGKKPIDLAEKLALVSKHWKPKTVADYDGNDVIVVKVQGEFVWPGELHVVPKRVEHCPIAEEEMHILLIEPAGAPNTGDAASAVEALPT